jgi:hypothetical protein
VKADSIESKQTRIYTAEAFVEHHAAMSSNIAGSNRFTASMIPEFFLAYTS